MATLAGRLLIAIFISTMTIGPAMRPLTSSLLSLSLLLASCKPNQEPAVSNAPADGVNSAIVTVNYPLQYMAERLVRDAVDVQFPAPADEDPAFWQPDDAAIATFQNARLILMNGATYSKWADKVSLPASKVVDTSAAFRDRFIKIEQATTHSHGPGGEHSHAGTAFTTWIDFDQAARQAEAVAAAVSKSWPDLAPQVEKNLASLVADLQALDQRMQVVGNRIAGAPLVASHPVYHYWARRYGINLQSVLWEPETVPNDKAMQELQTLLGQHPAKWMIWEGEPAKESVAKLEALAVKSIVFDPCGNVPEEGDFMTVMKANVAALEKAFP